MNPYALYGQQWSEPDEPPRPYGYVVPWSGETVTVPIDTPPDVPTFQPLTDVPTPGPVIQFVGKGLQAAWDDVWSWVSHTAKHELGALATGLEDYVQAAMSIVEEYVGNSVKALSGFINDVGTYAESGFETAAVISADVLGYAVSEVMAIDGYIDAILQALLQAGANTLDLIGAAITAAEGYALDVAEAGDALVKQWVIDDIYSPLLDGFVTSIDDLRTLLDEAVGALQTQINGIDGTYIPDIVAAIAGLLTITEGLTTTMDECAVPTCDFVGPNSDLGKLLKSLEGLLGILATLAVADMSLDELERLANNIAALASPGADAFVSAFVGGGETVEQAGGAILGDVSGAAGDVLSALGIPV